MFNKSLIYRLVYMSKVGMEDGDKTLVDKGSEIENVVDPDVL